MEQKEGGLDTFGAALAYVSQHGFSVIPVRAGDKRPLGPWEEFQARRPTDAELERWFGNGHAPNVGVVCGAVSGVVVLDIDGPAGEQALAGVKLPVTPTVRTPRGRHLYFRHPGGRVPPAVGIRDHVDVRGDGSYVVAPPSARSEGGYAWLGEGLDLPAGMALMPAWMAETPKRTAATELPQAIPHGQRNAALASLAGSMRRRGAGQDTIQLALAQENAVRCDPPLRPEEVATIAQSVSRYPPAEDPRKDDAVPGLVSVSWRELIDRADAAGQSSWLIRRLWPGDAYGVIGAEDKAGKTFAALDLAVSVVTGTPWLNHHPVDVTGPALVYLGEGGSRGTVRRLAGILHDRGLTAPDLNGMRFVENVPRLTRPADISAVRRELEEHAPALVIVDPLYLAAAGARGSDLYAMGESLMAIQQECQAAGAALVVVTHWNKTGEGSGAKRFTGVGPGAWGRVLGSAAVEQRFTEPGKETVTLRWEFSGGEIEGQTFRARRSVWSEDPDNLGSVLHYHVEVTEEAAGIGYDDGDRRPSERRILAILERARDRGAAELTVRQVGDELAKDGLGSALKRPTIQNALAAMAGDGLVDSESGLEGPGKRWWRQ